MAHKKSLQKKEVHRLNSLYQSWKQVSMEDRMNRPDIKERSYVILEENPELITQNSEVILMHIIQLESMRSLEILFNLIKEQNWDSWPGLNKPFEPGGIQNNKNELAEDIAYQIGRPIMGDLIKEFKEIHFVKKERALLGEITVSSIPNEPNNPSLEQPLEEVKLSKKKMRL